MLPQGAEVVTGVAASGAVAEAAPGEHYRCSSFFLSVRFFTLINHVSYINCRTQKIIPTQSGSIRQMLLHENVFMRLLRILKISYYRKLVRVL